MVKVRMNTADVAAEVRCLRKLIGMRCANVYDLSAKIYMFKLMRSSGVTESGESEKNLLLIESGVRLHTTAFARDKSMTPSGFTLKLRKHIRTKRLEDVRQLGIDRIVDFQFGLGESAHHIILELYSQGNVLLTDADYTVLTLLRTHRDDEKHLTMMVRHQYPIDSSRLFEKTSIEKLEMWLLGQKISKGSVAVQESSEKHDSGINTSSKGQLAGNGEANVKDIQVKVHGKKTDSGGGKGDKVTLKTVLGERLGYGPALSEHIVLDVGLSPNMKVSSENDKGVISPSKEQIEVLYAAVMRFEAWLEDIVSGEQIPRGYIIMQSKGVKKQQTPSWVEGQCKMYDDFSPIMLNQFKGRELIETETFDAAMDEFFSKIEGQRAEQQRKAQEESALSKLDKIRKDQASRVEVLKKEVDQSVHMAELIEYNLEDVDSAILAVRTALAMGMDWNDLARMVKEERKAGNPVAGLIHSLHLEKNQITLLLSNNLDDMDEEEKTLPVDKVEVDLALSAYANARRWFEMKKRQANKQEKTELAHEKALKAAEKKTQQQLSQAKTVAAISHLRKVHWFEKFNWFISSENYLIISGRDAQQNELVVKRYLKKGDLYVHADLHGASSTVIKNHNPDHPVPPLTLNQAGCFTVCRSQAWDSKIVTSAWWVYAHQVSKTAPTGEYLTAGSFMIRGRKNFLPPHPLVMGFGILFKLDESSIAAHLNERKIRGEGEEDDVESQDVYEEVQMDTVDESDEIVQNSIDVMNPIDVNALQITGTIEVFDELSRRELAISVEENEEEHTSGISEYIERRGESFKKVVNDSEEYAIKEENKASLDKMESQSTEEFDELMDKALELSLYPKLSKQGKKYGLADYSKVAEKDRLEDGSSVEGASGKVLQRERPYLSKVDRRKLKKVANDVDDKKDINTKHESIETTLEKASQQVETFMPNETFKEASGTGRDETRVEAAGKIGRGRKGKLKKIKEKYAEQDDEERELRMALLASAGKSESKLAGRAASKKDKGITAKLPKVENPDNGKVDSSKICYKCKRSGHIARDCSVAVSDSNDLQGEGAIESNDGGTLLREEEMEKIALMTEENILDLGEDEKEKLTELDSLTGSPLSDDILLYAVPVCGPYSALQGYKYRVKITPGTSKRGKAAKTAINLFIHMQDMSPREKELLKAITDPELVAAFISNAKVTAPGLTQLKQRQKKGKKALVGEE